MKQQLLFLIIIIFGISVCSEAVEISKIIEISGNAVIADTENNETTPKPGMILLPGYILKTSENSKIIFNLYNVYILELAENSELKILGLKITSTKQKQKNADMMFKLIKGEVSGTVNKRKSKSLKSNFIIETDYSKNFVNNAVFSVISKDYSIVSVDTGTVIIEKNIKNDDNKNIKAVSNTKVIIKSEKTEIDSENKFDSAVTEFLPEYFDKPIIIDQGYNKIGNQDEYEYYIKLSNITPKTTATIELYDKNYKEYLKQSMNSNKTNFDLNETIEFKTKIKLVENNFYHKFFIDKK